MNLRSEQKKYNRTGMRNISLTFLYIAILGFATIRAQDTMHVENAIAIALQHNFDIRLARIDSTSKALDNSYSYTVFLPTLNGTATKIWNVNYQRQQLADGTKVQRDGIRSNNLNASVNLNWTLFDGLNMFASRERLAEIEALGILNVRNRVNNAIATVINTYFNIVQQKQQLKAIEEEITVNEERVKLSDRKLSVGLGAKPELLQAKVDLNAQKAARLQQQTLIAQSMEQLNQLIGQAVNTRYLVTDSIPLNLGISLEEIRNNLESTNYSLLLAKKNIDISEIQLKQVKSGFFPILSFTSAYNFSRTNNQVVINNFTPLFNQNRGPNYGFTATVPIFNQFNVRRQVQQAKLNIETQQVRFDSARLFIDLSVVNAYKNYEYARNALQLEEENIQLAKENVFIALEVYRQGVSTYLDLRTAQTSLDSAYSRLISARYNTKLAETELLRLKGNMLK